MKTIYFYLIITIKIVEWGDFYENSILKRIFVILLSGVMAFSAYGSMPISTISVSATETSLSNMPAAITGLKFTSQTNSITLSWNMSEDASGYYVYVKSSKEPYNFLNMLLLKMEKLQVGQAKI